MELNMSLGLSSLGTTEDNKYDVIIIGGGPGGASTAIYTARADLRTLVIDKGLTAGALGITTQISNYPGVPGPVTGAELVEIMRQQAESFGAKFITDKVVGIDFSGEEKMVMAGTGSLYAKAIVLATGSMGRTNSVKGEADLLGVGVVALHAELGPGLIDQLNLTRRTLAVDKVKGLVVGYTDSRSRRRAAASYMGGLLRGAAHSFTVQHLVPTAAPGARTGRAAPRSFPIGASPTLGTVACRWWP